MWCTKKQDQNNFWDKEGNGIFMMCKHKTHPIIRGSKQFSWQTVFTFLNIQKIWNRHSLF